MRLEGGIVYEAEINPINGRKAILAYARRGGKVTNWVPAGAWVSVCQIRVNSLLTFVWLQLQELFY